MSKIVWDKDGERFYETGSDRCVLFPKNNTSSEGNGYANGVAWNGFRGLSENRSGAEETALYANNKKYLGIRSAEEFGGTINAYTYPDEWGACDGSASPVEGVSIGQQPRVPFGLTFRTYVGNDTNGSNYDYIIHLIYNAMASPSSRDFTSIGESVEAVELSWEFTTTPVDVADYKPTSHLEIDSRKVKKDALKKLEDLLYGTTDKEPSLPSPDEVIALFKNPGA